MHDAYMIRNDGEQFPCQVHYYFRENDVFRCMETGEWYCDATNRSDIKDHFINLVAWYAKYNLGCTSIQDFLKKLEELYYPVSDDFVKSNASEIEFAFEQVKDDFETYLKPLFVAMNQEFMRERIGGMYETNYGIKDIYFRISSTGFNWYNIIWQFVYDNKNRIDSVTIVRDAESTGEKDKYYTGNAGVYDHMPVEDFITESGNPVIESKYFMPFSVGRCLFDGGCSLDFKDLPMNPLRAQKDYDALLLRENKNPMFFYPELISLARVLNGEDVRSVFVPGWQSE